ncbi:NusG, N-terminal [Dillenia turbinata]|uniref:NusG, N-terminal n=1 Tax=Dillenia turbinata TaxID=194707 RepID=A0AAN8VY98_9MAGN
MSKYSISIHERFQATAKAAKIEGEKRIVSHGQISERKMGQGILLWSPSIALPITNMPKTHKPKTLISSTVKTDNNESLTARERRQLRNKIREEKAYNWREEVEERLIKKPKKKYTSWTEELNLDNLADSGPQWWVVRCSRVLGQDTAERLAKSLARNYPNIDFKVYVPTVQLKRKLKNGTLSVKSKPLFPGCIFLRCVLNKELHDFIRECDGVGGFVGSRVGNTKRQINRPKPVSADDMEAIFKKAKEEQEIADQAFENDEQGGNSQSDPQNILDSITEPTTKRRSRKSSGSSLDSQLTGRKNKLLIPDSSVRVVSGPFADFSGSLKKLDHKAGKATVGFTLFGKETLVDLNIGEIVLETK